MPVAVLPVTSCLALAASIIRDSGLRWRRMEGGRAVLAVVGRPPPLRWKAAGGSLLAFLRRKQDMQRPTREPGLCRAYMMRD